MIDIKIVRDNPQLLKDALERRHMDTAVVDQLADLDEEWRAKLTRVEELKAERNTVSKEIGKIKDKEEREKKIAEMRAVGDKITAMDEEVKGIEEKTAEHHLHGAQFTCQRSTAGCGRKRECRHARGGRKT